MFIVFDLCLLYLRGKPMGRNRHCHFKVLQVVFPVLLSSLFLPQPCLTCPGKGERAVLVRPDATLRIFWMRGECAGRVLPRHAGMSAVMYCPCVALKFFCQRSSATDWGGMWWMPLHVTDISAPIDYNNTSDTGWHKCVLMTAHLSSHSSLLFFFFPQYAKDLWTNRLKIPSNHSLVSTEARLSE